VCLKYALLIYFIFGGTIFAQSFSKASVNVKARLVNGAMTDVIKFNLEANDYPRKILQEVKKYETEGMLLRFSGGKSNNIIIDYEHSQANDINLQNKLILVERMVKESDNLVFEKSIKVFNGSSLSIGKEEHREMYLWIDHNLIKDNSEHQNNLDTFILSLVYN
jgi:hypothetical protein